MQGELTTNETMIDMDMEKLEVKTHARVDYVMECYEVGEPVNWEEADMFAEIAASDLERERSLEPMRTAGRAMRDFVDAVTAMFGAFNEGFNGHD